MAEKFDVASRLAEGRPAVENVQNYVWACHLLGYQNPDLTLHASQVRDWYGSEDGLDLRALDADCAALEAAVAATEEALARQDDQLAAVSAAWQGRGADASREFLRRHGVASAAATSAVRTAADALVALRDRLWHAVDGKVAAALAIDDRVQARRAEWLAAAQTVTTGAGDRSAASELIDQQVNPFVDNDIRGDWLAAMRTAMASVADAYDAAAAELGAEPDVLFGVPGELGPSWTPPPREELAAAPVVAASAPAAGSAPPVSSASMPSGPMPMASPAASASPIPSPSSSSVEPTSAAPAMAASPMPSLGGMGGGMPDIGSGFSGFGQQLADTLGGLLGSSDGAPLDPPEVEEPPELEDPDIVDEESEDKAKEDDDTETDPVADEVDVCETPVEVPPPVEEPPPVEPAPPPEPAATPAPVPPPPEPAPPPEPMAATGTPCEIAADELPQVGQ